MNDNPLKSIPLPSLRALLAAAEQAKATAAADIEAIQGEITERLSGDATAQFLKAEKLAGDVTFEAADGGKYKASISKTVAWDNKQLQNVAKTMNWEDAQQLFDIKFTVPENKYKALIDQKLKALLDEARTVKYGALSIKPVEDK